MLTIEQAIRALRREILAALTEEASLPNGSSLVADRISVSLAVQLEPTKAAEDPGRLVVATEPTRGLHHITLEFCVKSAAQSESLSAQVLNQPAARQIVESRAEDPVFAALSEVFGVPGFDSSARATVFREALAELSEEQRRRVLVSLEATPSPGEEAAVTQARHRVLCLAASGPAGRENGPALLRRLGEREAVDELIQLAAERWRTQSEWAAASSPMT